MADLPHESENPYPELDIRTIGEINAAAEEWLANNQATKPEEALVREFQTYYNSLPELPLDLGASSYEVMTADGTELTMWPRANTPAGRLYDVVSVDEDEEVMIRPFVVIGSLVTLVDLDDISDELRDHVSTLCMMYAMSGSTAASALDAEGIPMVITPTLCDDAYLILAPVYMGMQDRIEELPVADDTGYSAGQAMWRIAARNTSGVTEQFLVEANAVFSEHRLVAAHAARPDGTIDDMRTYMAGPDD